MSTKQDILKSLATRTGRKGVLTADRYFRSIEQCFDGGFCPVKLFNVASQAEWEKALKESEGKLTYSNGEMLVKTDSVSRDYAFGDDQLAGMGWRKHLTGKPLVVFDAIVTTTTRDRDMDVMETKGAELDPASPLLWQHNPLQPIGGLVGELKDKRTDDMLPARFAIADTELGRDAATLIEMGALRISHGFDPKEFEPMDDDEGWHFKTFEIFEVSLVSVPANKDAVITAFSREKLHSPLIRGWAEKMFQERPVQGIGYSTRMKHGNLEFEWSAPTKEGVQELIEAHQDDAFKNGRLPKIDISASKVKNKLNNRKDFDVERQHIEAATIEYDWISRFCSCEVKQLVNFDTFSANIRMGSFLTGLKYALADSDEVDARRLTRHGTETPLEYETVQLNSRKSDHFLVDGISFRKFGDGTCFVAKYCRHWDGIYIELLSSQKDMERISDVLSKAHTWAENNNFLKGEAFSLGGEFLAKTDETWGDLFLDSKNELEIKRTVTLLNQKGAQCPNRGQIFMGPPGTGKTLSGRLIRNHANATFIWVGGKDAYYYGGINSVVMSFDLAKELAPAIVFLEDIDAALDSRYAVDVLKTEMDGIGRSSGVVTILTTNHPEAFPEALVDRPGRFDDVLKFGLPNEKIRKQMIVKWLPDNSESNKSELAKKTEGYSGAHLYELCKYATVLQDQDGIGIDEAALKALSKIVEQRELINEELMSDRRVISQRRDRSISSRKIGKSPIFSKNKLFANYKCRLESYREVEQKLMMLATKESLGTVKNTHARFGVAVNKKEKAAFAKFLAEVGIT